MTALRSCPFCERCWMRWDQYACNECGGVNSQKSYRERSKNLAACLRDAATEEMRVRVACARMKETP